MRLATISRSAVVIARPVTTGTLSGLCTDVVVSTAGASGAAAGASDLSMVSAHRRQPGLRAAGPRLGLTGCFQRPEIVGAIIVTGAGVVSAGDCTAAPRRRDHSMLGAVFARLQRCAAAIAGRGPGRCMEKAPGRITSMQRKMQRQRQADGALDRRVVAATPSTGPSPNLPAIVNSRPAGAARSAPRASGAAARSRSCLRSSRPRRC